MQPGPGARPGYPQCLPALSAIRLPALPSLAFMPHAFCPMPHAPCLMPHAPCFTLHAPCSLIPQVSTPVPRPSVSPSTCQTSNIRPETSHFNERGGVHGSGSVNTESRFRFIMLPDPSLHLMDPIISVYAELLSNIGQITIAVVLASPCNPDTTIELSQDRETLLIAHHAQRIVARLPAALDPAAVLPRPLPPTKDLVFRLGISRERHCSRRNGPEWDDQGIWPASSLTPDTRIACRACKSQLLQGSVTRWKDLPSDHWADMMDLWHCHKPNPDHGTGRDAVRGAEADAASNSLAPSPGVGFVHLNEIRIHESACVGLQVRWSFSSCPCFSISW